MASTATSCSSSRSDEDSALYRGTVWIDRAHVRANSGQGGPGRPSRAGRVQRRDPSLRHRGDDREPADLSLWRAVRAADRARRRTESPGREGSDVSATSASTTRSSSASANGRASRAIASCSARPTPAFGTTSRRVSPASSAIRQTSRSKRWRWACTWIRPTRFRCRSSDINYLNFSLGGIENTQFALLFGGVLAAGNIQRPKLGSTVLDASVDFFAIAVPSSDRLYGPDGEVGFRTCADVADVHRPQPWMAGDTLPEGHASVSTALRRVHPRHDDGGDVSSLRRAR